MWIYTKFMNTEHQALAEYLGDIFEKKFDQKLDQRLKNQSKDLFSYMDRRFNQVDEQLKDVKRDLKNLILHVDSKNDDQDAIIEIHNKRISDLEIDYQMIVSRM